MKRLIGLSALGILLALAVPSAASDAPCDPTAKLCLKYPGPYVPPAFIELEGPGNADQLCGSYLLRDSAVYPPARILVVCRNQKKSASPLAWKFLLEPVRRESTIEFDDLWVTDTQSGTRYPLEVEPQLALPVIQDISTTRLPRGGRVQTTLRRDAFVELHVSLSGGRCRGDKNRHFGVTRGRFRETAGTVDLDRQLPRRRIRRFKRACDWVKLWVGVNVSAGGWLTGGDGLRPLLLKRPRP